MHEQSDLTAVVRLASNEGNTYRASRPLTQRPVRTPPTQVTHDENSNAIYRKHKREGKLPDDWRKVAATRPSGLSLAEGNGNPLTITSAVRFCFRLGYTSFHVWFQVCPTLSVDIIIGTEFANENLKAIWCMDQQVTLRDNTEVPILSSHPDFHRAEAERTMVVTAMKDKQETLQ